MKKKALMLGLILTFTLGAQTVANAAEVGKVVSLTDDNGINYQEGTTSLEEAFTGMAPGDTRTVAIKIENNSSYLASFFVSQETVTSLEETNRASGGAYEFTLSVGKTEATAVPLLEAEAGGYTDGASANANGLYDIDELESYQYLAELSSKDETYVYLTFAIDGEGFDSTSTVNYENAAAALNMNFRAYYAYEDEGDRAPVVVTEHRTVRGADNVVTRIIDQVVPMAATSSPVTGDTNVVMVTVGILVIGVTVIVIAMKKRKAGNK